VISVSLNMVRCFPLCEVYFPSLAKTLIELAIVNKKKLTIPWLDVAYRCVVLDLSSIVSKLEYMTAFSNNDFH
jgi:hypothetical protein